MGRIGKVIVILFLLSLLTTQFVLSLDDVDKVYFQQQQEKLIAQVNSKIDTQTNRIEQNLKTSIETSKQEIRTALSNEIKGSLRAVAIGLSGLIIITLAIFKVIDLKISSTRNIKKYETIIQQKTEELNQIILQATMERNELANSRMQLADYQKRLSMWDKQLQANSQQVNQAMMQYGLQPTFGQQPQQQLHQQMPNLNQPFQMPQPPKTPPNFPQNYYPQQFPPQTQEKPKSVLKTILMIILILAVLGLLGLTIYKFFILPQ